MRRSQFGRDLGARCPADKQRLGTIVGRRRVARVSGYTPVVDEVVREPGPTLAEPTEEGLRLVDAASAHGIVLRLVGGVAIWARCPSARRPPLARRYNDIDFVTRSGSTAAVTAFFADQGYEPNRMFNALHGAQRLMYADPAHERIVDLLVDQFAMCHRLDLRDRLALEARTLPLADLLLTKLQVVELNEKDLKDLLALLADHDLDGEDVDAIGTARVLAVTGDDWGFEHTIRMTLARVRDAAHEYDLDGVVVQAIHARIDRLVEILDRARKTLRWRVRARLGERVRWYELPEEVRR
jgi:hypothetical protein